MAVFSQDPFPGTDYSQYQSWPKVTAPGGQVFFEVPGNPGYVFDPVASNASGRKVFRPNPKLSIEKQKEEEEILRKAQEQDSFNKSPAGQLLPVAGSVGGLIAANEILKPAAGSSIADQLAAREAGMQIVDGKLVPLAQQGAPAAQTAGQAAAQGASAISASTTAIPAGTAIPEGFVGVGTAADGGTLIAPADVAADAGWFGGPSWLGAGDAFAGEASGVLPYAGAALGAYGLYNQFTDPSKNKFGSAAKGAAEGAAIGSVIPGVGTGIGAGVGALLGLGSSFLYHETTRERQAKVTDKLMKAAEGDPQAQAYVQGMREQFASAPPDPSKPFYNGTYGSWDEYQKAGLVADDLTGVEGNIDVYTPQVWAKLTQDQRRAVTQANIDSGLYSSKDGGVQITDEAKAKENFDNVMKGFNVGVQTAGQAAAQGANTQNVIEGTKPLLKGINPNSVVPIDPWANQATRWLPPETTVQAPTMVINQNTGQPVPITATPGQVAAQMARTKTLSPGVGLDGRPIFYGRR